MIPSTIVCTTKVALINFYNAHKRIIIKDISAPFSYYKENMRILSLTTEITECELENIPEKFYPSLFQELIEKKYELRVFYLEEICYSMAIFSQNDKQTSVDFRNYNHTKPNRRIPYNLPIEIKLKVVALMKDLNLETGSIDFIVTTSGDYIFLEVNPVGQFGMTSYPCNYYLEKKVAEYLIKNENG
jgi:ATP-GRASP peptide maturase of grasp-with-spasm system